LQLSRPQLVSSTRFYQCLIRRQCEGGTVDFGLCPQRMTRSGCWRRSSRAGGLRRQREVISKARTPQLGGPIILRGYLAALRSSV
jgi:hypothetical protein